MPTDMPTDRPKETLDLSWKAQFETGHPRIDNEHRAFLDLIRTLGHAVQAGDARERILRLFDELKAYSHFHFISEENIMIDHGYPDHDHHAQLHRTLLEDLNRYSVRYELGDLKPLDFLAFLAEWFVHHTQHEDVRIAAYVALNPCPTDARP